MFCRAALGPMKGFVDQEGREIVLIFHEPSMNPA
jgi:hypothetical protein